MADQPCPSKLYLQIWSQISFFYLFHTQVSMTLSHSRILALLHEFKGKFLSFFYCILRICWTLPNLIFSRLVLRASHGFILTMQWLMTGEYICCQMIPSHFWSEACKKEFCAGTCKSSLPIVPIVAGQIGPHSSRLPLGRNKILFQQSNVCDLKSVRQRWHVQPTKFKTLLEICSHGIELDVLTIFFMLETKKKSRNYTLITPQIY